MKKLTKVDRIAYIFLITTFIWGLYFFNLDFSKFDETYDIEDGFIEYATFVFLLSSSLLLFYRYIKLHSNKKKLWKFGMLAISFMFLFAAGEEISWGQRIFNIKSSDYFLQYNAQEETNLHNLIVDGKKINKIIFSQLLTAVLIVYLIFTPLLYRKFKVIMNLADKLAVPIVKWHHTIAFLISTLLLVFMTSVFKWELYELSFSVIFFLIFLDPLNQSIYKKTP